LLVAGLIASESRGGFLTFIIVSALTAWSFRLHFRPHYLGLIIGAVGVAAIGFLVSVPQDYWERQATLQLLGAAVTESRAHLHEDAALDRRAAYLIVAGQAFVDAPLLGHGPDTFDEIWFRSSVSDAYKNERRPAHNTYAEVLVGSGLTGLAVFVGLLWVVYKNYRNAEIELRRIGDLRGAQLCGCYRIAFIGVLAYLFLKSGLDHKLFLLAIPLSGSVRGFARRRASSESVDDKSAGAGLQMR
jgi:O-antigen ligase